METRLGVVLGGSGGGGLECVGAGGAAPGIGGGGRLFLLLCSKGKPGEVGDVSSPIYELRLSFENRGDIGREGDAIGIGGPWLVDDVSAWGVSSGFEVFSDISSSEAEPRLGDMIAAGGGGGGGRAKNTALDYSMSRIVISTLTVCRYRGWCWAPLGSWWQGSCYFSCGYVVSACQTSQLEAYALGY